MEILKHSNNILLIKLKRSKCNLQNKENQATIGDT